MNNDPAPWPLQQLIAGLERRLDRIETNQTAARTENTRQHQELQRQFTGLAAQITGALGDIGELKHWRDGHNEHHGINDEAIKARIDGIDRERAEEDAREEGAADERRRWAERLEPLRSLLLKALEAGGLIALGWGTAMVWRLL